MSFRDWTKPSSPPYFQTLVTAFGAAAATKSYRLLGPKGAKGFVRDILVDVATTMVGTTTVPEINIGAAASVPGTPSVTYGRFRLGTTAILGYDTTNVLRARNLVTGNGDFQRYSDYAGHVDLETTMIPRDTAFFVTLLEGVGGTPAGAASVSIFIDWF